MSSPASPAHSKSNEMIESQPSHLVRDRCRQETRSRKFHEANKIEPFRINKYNKLEADEAYKAGVIFRRLQILPVRYLKSMKSEEITTFASLMTKAYPWSPLKTLVIINYRVAKLEGKVHWLTKSSSFVEWWERARCGPLETDIASPKGTVFDVGDNVDKSQMRSLDTKVPLIAYEAAKSPPPTSVKEDGTTGKDAVVEISIARKRARADSTSSSNSSIESTKHQYTSLSPETSPEPLHSRTPTSQEAKVPEAKKPDKQTPRKKRKHDAIATTKPAESPSSIEIIDLVSPTYDASKAPLHVKPVHPDKKSNILKRKTAEDVPSKRPRSYAPPDTDVDVRVVEKPKRFRIKLNAKNAKK